MLRVADVLVTMCQCFMPPLHSGNDEESASREILIQPLAAWFRSISLGAAEQRVVPGPACSLVSGRGAALGKVENVAKVCSCDHHHQLW